MPTTDYSYGLHWGPHEYFVGDQMDPFVAEMKAMGMGLVTTLNKDLYSFEKFRNAGMKVLFRPQMDCTQLYEDTVGLTNMLLAGIEPLVAPYNEPSDNREWGMEGVVPANYVEIWINRWIDAAWRIHNGGGRPGIQCLDPEEELRPLLRRIKELGYEALLENAWISVHNYSDCHPPDFGLNPQRDGYDVYDPDGRGLLSFVSPLTFQKVYKEETGKEADVWCTEGGWTVGDSADNRFPRVTLDLHSQYTLEVVRAFKAGFLPDWKTPWPRWWKGFTLWLVASTAMQGPMSFEMNAWYYSQIRDPYSTLTLTINPLKELSGGQPIRPSFEEEPMPNQLTDDMEQWFTSPNFTPGRVVLIDSIIIHSTRGGQTLGIEAQATMDWFMNPASQASAHLLITQKGQFVHFVADEDTAWAAEGYNPYSLQVELEQPDNDTPFSQIQMERLAEAILWWGAKHDLTLSPETVIGHETLNPGKSDPGKMFDWQMLWSDLGVAWKDERAEIIDSIDADLDTIRAKLERLRAV